ncbi:accessory gene regulator B family protein [Brevibacillus laterosporus]|uniref:accessory gene regulator ArgB-like protein n=1 Tax=Brevibacillus laterosporus TaxID=1465 RepID=UPI00037772B0|nr:accessory gene regulator B family protein [Brevibacillus laterosporus]ATO50098.1 hypothetical protein BrL25_14040 [Brevibacillus laterosporus DSM 25]MED2005441.1 accessory gene regulator B family protein [Brevibacillus laterosporus]
MIEKLSHFFAIKIYEANPDKKESIDVLSYSLSITLNYFLVFSFSLLIGYSTNEFVSTIISMVSFIVLRIFSKGYHAKSLTTCFILTTAIIATIPHVKAQEYTDVINIVNVFLVLFLAPNDSYEEEAILKKRVYLLKVISLVIVLSNFIISSHIVALSFFAQSLLLLPRRR